MQPFDHKKVLIRATELCDAIITNQRLGTEFVELMCLQWQLAIDSDRPYSIEVDQAVKLVCKLKKSMFNQFGEGTIWEG